MHVEVNIPAKEDCLKSCQEAEGCNWFTYFSSSLTCIHMVDCQTLDETCTDCISGESSCKEEEGNLNTHKNHFI